MIPRLEKNGRLPGIHWATWHEFAFRFGRNRPRQRLLRGLKAAMKNLKAARCPTVYIDGSFVTSKKSPADYDACWDMDGFDPTVLDPLFADFSKDRAAQKAKYGGELFPVYLPDVGVGRTFLELFQVDKKTGQAKGIVAIDLRSEQL